MEEPQGGARADDGPAGQEAAVRAPTPVPVRVGVGLLCAGGVALLLWLDSLCGQHGYVLGAAGALLVVACLGEYRRLAGGLGVELSAWALSLAGAGLYVAVWTGWAYDPDYEWVPDPGRIAAGCIGLATLAALAWPAVTGRIAGATQRCAAFVLGLCYVGLSLTYLGGLRERFGLGALVTTLVVCKVTDVGGYAGGKLIGGMALAPRVSPRKTVAGAVGGTVFACSVSVALAVLHVSGFRPLYAILYGLLVAWVGMVGDLSESVLKREAGMKDSGSLLPGQGGWLDMLDGVFFVAPLSYWLYDIAA